MLVKSASDVPIEIFFFLLLFSFLAFVLLFGVSGIDNVSRNRSFPAISARFDVFSTVPSSELMRNLRITTPTDASTTLYQRLNAFRTTAGFSLDLFFLFSFSRSFETSLLTIMCATLVALIPHFTSSLLGLVLLIIPGHGAIG